MVAVAIPGWTRLSFNDISNRDWMAAYGRTSTSGTDERGCVIRPRPGDINHDSLVNLADFATFAICYAGSGVTIPPPDCSEEEMLDCDMDEDGDVDLSDFSTFAANYGL
jgi:hypothetical protein